MVTDRKCRKISVGNIVNIKTVVEIKSQKQGKIQFYSRINNNKLKAEILSF